MFVKANYGSRKNYSIETAILEKRLIMDRSMLSSKITVCNLTDLQSCYDRQLANVRSIVEESAGRNREAMILFTKIMPIFNHYMCTGFGISNAPYGGRQEQLAGTGQGNKFSVDMCRDVSCLIIKEIENGNLGIKFKVPIIEEEEQCVSISFVDNTDLITEGDDSEAKMQEIIDAYE